MSADISAIDRTTDPPCKLCGGPTFLKFSRSLLDGRFEASYFECRACEMLQSRHLDVAAPEIVSEIYSQGTRHDVGAAWRQWCIAERLWQLARLRVARRRDRPMRALDLGAGSGFCVGFMQYRLGWNAYGYDLFATPSFAPDRFLPDWDSVLNAGPFDFILASEVFEHFCDPAREITQIAGVLNPDGGLMFVTTERFKPHLHDAEWTYLAPQSGQHVAFYSPATFSEIARRIGDAGWTSLATESEWLIYRNANRRKMLPYHIAAGAAALSLGAKIGLIHRIV